MTKEKWAGFSKRAWGIGMLIVSGISQYSSYEIPLEAVESTRQIAEPLFVAVGGVIATYGATVATGPLYWFRRK